MCLNRKILSFFLISLAFAQRVQASGTFLPPPPPPQPAEIECEGEDADKNPECKKENE